MAGISFDRAADLYDATRGLPPPLMEAAVDALADALRGEGPILEVGVGTGRFAAPLERRGVRVVGLDISQKMIAKAREKGARDLILGSATSMPFRDRAFRATLAVHVLHLIADWKDALREIARVTSGRFVTLLETITTKAMDSAEMPRPGHGPGDVYHPIREYEEIAAKWGYHYEHPGVRPPQMMERAPPEFRIPVGRYREVLPGETLLAPAATKSYSSQWAVPDDVHAKVMEELTRDMQGREFERTFEIELVGWSPAALARM
jgi:SAM-dependent methyltransferase